MSGAAPELSTVSMDVRVGECLDMHGIVKIELVQKSGQFARLRVTAPRDVRIERKPANKSPSFVPSMAD